MSDFDNLTKRIVNFCEEREWTQFHDPKDLALSLMLEAAEVLEHFQWKSPDEIEHYVKSNKDEIADELVDVLYWVLLTSYYLKINLTKAFDKKMTENERKYPITKAKGTHKKYTEL